jgi:hypothetical protein
MAAASAIRRRLPPVGIRPGRRSAAFGLALGLLLAGAAQPAEQPLFEFGLGAGAVAFEDYRGSATTHADPVPVPYLRYNGTFLKSDREGVRGTLFDLTSFELNLSGNVTTPVRHDSARSGMPDLKSTLELGPSFDFHLWRSTDSRIKLDLRLPLRAALAVESPPHSIGGTFTPRLAASVADPLGCAGCNLGVQVGPLLKRFRRYWVGAYVRADTLAGAAFAASPLVHRKGYWSAGIGFAWILHTSTRMVEVTE